ncbi:ABC transporter ATP-binding protein [Variovorax sp. M-6]|uniref:ABC transporter ATP-binding protein n=1 Tax=Variovorax sp. M-6 TaxID=3233041 RepID=UPI003F9835D1
MTSTTHRDTGGVPLLEIDNLRIAFATPQGRSEAVRGVSLRMGRERLAVVGESGSGKSITFRSLLGLLPASATVSAQRMALDGRNLLGLDARGLRQVRGRRIGMVVQDPRQGLDPLMTIGRQLAEMLRLHGKAPRLGVQRRVRELLAEVHIREPGRVADLYPHQVSGGMAQRAMLAMMLSAEPDLLIADEATSALDAVVRHHMLALIDEQVRLRGMGLILISHDLDLVAGYADRVIVMYAGRVMEELPAGGMALAASHPYTRGLMACRPSLEHPGADLPVLNRDPAWLN